MHVLLTLEWCTYQVPHGSIHTYSNVYLLHIYLPYVKADACAGYTKTELGVVTRERHTATYLSVQCKKLLYDSGTQIIQVIYQDPILTYCCSIFMTA